ncbi:MAG TPA: peptidoglycan-associated lipoprotein Pal [Caulobacteraceae bacterium]
MIRPIKTSVLLRTATLVALVAATAACNPRPRPGPIDGGPGGGPVVEGPGGSPITGVDQGPGGQYRPGSAQEFEINVGDRVYFDFDSYSIRSDAYPRLDAQAAWLRRYPNVIVRVEGNADERGTREYNLALGARRAEAVRTFLIERGIPAGRIDTISFGKERPIAFGNDEESHARNRNARTAVVSGAN